MGEDNTTGVTYTGMGHSWFYINGVNVSSEVYIGIRMGELIEKIDKLLEKKEEESNG